MLYGADIDYLISLWTERMNNTAFPSPYRDALTDCVYELQSLLNETIEKELITMAPQHSDTWYS